MALSLMTVQVGSGFAQVPPVGQGAQWKLSPEPVLTIGEAGTAQGEFLRITGMTRTVSGHIVVANSGTNEIRIFNATGKFLKAYGGTGSGPGEFRSMHWVGKSGDSLFLFDELAVRISTFTVDGGFINSAPLRSIAGDARMHPAARFNNGDLLLEPVHARLQPKLKSDGGVRDSISFGVLRANQSDTTTWIGPFEFKNSLAGRESGAPVGHSVDRYESGSQSRWAVWGNLVWVGDAANNLIALYDKTGKVSSRAQLPWSVAPHDKVQFEPPFKYLLVSPEGHLWVERFHLDAATAAECVVMTRVGTIVARLTIPADFEPKEIGSDYVLGIRRDRAGGETVAMYRIWK